MKTNQTKSFFINLISNYLLLLLVCSLSLHAKFLVPK